MVVLVLVALRLKLNPMTPCCHSFLFILLLFPINQIIIYDNFQVNDSVGHFIFKETLFLLDTHRVTQLSIGMWPWNIS